MTITITRPCALLHTTGRELKALLEAVLAHASHDEEDVPALRQIHLEVRDGDLRLVCTDRYTMAIVRHRLASTTKDFACAFSICGRSIRDFAETFDDGAAVSVSIEENRLLLTTGEEASSIPGEQSWLPWRKALGRFLAPAPTPTGRFLINPAFLARLAPARALCEDAPLQVQLHGEHAAVVATLGQRFLALVMPMQNDKLSEAVPGRPLDGWFDMLDES